MSGVDPKLLAEYDAHAQRELGDFFGRSAPKPSPGPWRVKGPARERTPHGDFVTWVVLDANDKCVAECEHQVDAIFIAQNGPAA